MVVAYSWYISRQISGLRRLQTDLADRNRSDSLQLLRIQNDLNQLGLAMRDMLDSGEPYPLTAWSAQFERIRADLDDALARQEEVAVAAADAGAAPVSRQLGRAVLGRRRTASSTLAAQRTRGGSPRADPAVAAGAAGGAQHARWPGCSSRTTRPKKQTAQPGAGDLRSRAAAGVLVPRRDARGDRADEPVPDSRQPAAVRASSRRLSDERRELAQQLIATREATLREISRELHDEFGQLLTAMGSMLGRAGKQAPEGSPLRGDLREIGEIAQTALDNVRGLSQTLHPSILEELGLESTIDWYLSTVRAAARHRRCTYERRGERAIVDRRTTAIHVYRVLQEALSNVARHSGARHAFGAASRHDGRRCELEVEDHGRGLGADVAATRARAGGHARARRAARRHARVPAAAAGRHARAAARCRIAGRTAA